MKIFFSNVGIFILLIVFSPLVCFAEKINGKACYTYGDSESLLQAEQTVKMLAIRNAIESNTILIESTSQISNFQLTNDLIKSVATGQVQELKITKFSQSERTLCCMIEGVVDPLEMRDAIREYLTGGKENVRLTDNGWIRILSYNVSEQPYEEYYARLRKFSPSEIMPEQLKGKKIRRLYIKVLFLKPAKSIQEEILFEKTALGKISAALGEEYPHLRGTKIKQEPKFASDYHNKIFATFFDKNNLEIITLSDYIPAREKNEMLPGEEEIMLFFIPDDANTWKIWVPK